MTVAPGPGELLDALIYISFFLIPLQAVLASQVMRRMEFLVRMVLPVIRGQLDLQDSQDCLVDGDCVRPVIVGYHPSASVMPWV